VFVAYFKGGTEILLTAARKVGRAPEIPVGCLMIVNQKYWLGKKCATHGAECKFILYMILVGGNLKQRDSLEDLVVNGRIILEWITLINRQRCLIIV